MNDLLLRMSGTLHHLQLNAEVKLSDYAYRYSNIFRALALILSLLTQCTTTASFVDVLDLSLYKQLKTLTLPELNSDAQDATTYARFLQFVLRISAPTLESVVFPLPGGGYKLMDWAAIDKFFASPDFPRLRTVRIEAAETLRAYFEEKLPLLHELGTLKVDNHMR
ncbi:hypothetical protein B0H17DRAFT_1326222 [Mycena rosella]|uniref:Uncharacterized protein n=1 Tax=Mycena rosella TaxID=1033263 RepID=A0AAD7GU79_MYCRO|nr:hypothetical protein B0H17DRAFT_1326222 [Mycena rosella]